MDNEKGEHGTIFTAGNIEQNTNATSNKSFKINTMASNETINQTPRIENSNKTDENELKENTLEDIKVSKLNKQSEKEVIENDKSPKSPKKNRGPGRPKKDVEEEEIKTVKRSRGRPKSTKNIESDEAEPTFPVFKEPTKKRGRPKKNITEQKQTNAEKVINLEKIPDKKVETEESKSERELSKLIGEINSDPCTYELLKFHLARRYELIKLSEKFNFIFYGYGEKKNLLLKMFPGSKVINCLDKTDGDLLQELHECITGDESPKALGYEKVSERIKEMNQHIKNRGDKSVILIHPPISLLLLISDLKNLFILATQDNTDFKYSKRQLVGSKFLMVDLPTFIPYEEVNDAVRAFEKCITSDILKVMLNVPQKSMEVFKEILILCSQAGFKRAGFKIQLQAFLEVIKEKYLITDVNVVNKHLIEFVEHDFLKRVDGGYSCKFSSADSQEVLELLKGT